MDEQEDHFVVNQILFIFVIIMSFFSFIFYMHPNWCKHMFMFMFFLLSLFKVTLSFEGLFHVLWHIHCDYLDIIFLIQVVTIKFDLFYSRFLLIKKNKWYSCDHIIVQNWNFQLFFIKRHLLCWCELWCHRDVFWSSYFEFLYLHTLLFHLLHDHLFRFIAFELNKLIFYHFISFHFFLFFLIFYSQLSIRSIRCFHFVLNSLFFCFLYFFFELF